MGYSSLRECALDLEHHGHLIRVREQVDPYLEMAELQRRLYANRGPAVLFENVKGSGFPALCNLFGTPERARFIFRDTLRHVQRVVEAKADASAVLRAPWRFARTPFTALKSLPRRVNSGPVLAHRTTIERLPPIQSWPDDGGPFVTLPQVYTEDLDQPGARHANVGMYRIQLSGNEYVTNKEVGLHYQIHRSIGVHHAVAIRAGAELRANVFVGGPPAMNLAAVMPLPEGISELVFAGALGGRRVRMIRQAETLPIHAEADFCIVGTVDATKRLPEGPFGDHLGYYSLVHDFPVLRVEHVYHRTGAIWPFTVVGRPPQEDTIYGRLIHELTGPAIPSVLPGVHAVHAVDASGVHPLLLAIGSERYIPYTPTTQPQELLTQANAILGQGQLSLAKYLMIVAREDNPDLDIHDVAKFLQHLLERVDWRQDLHFQTRTTIDTLDYSGSGLNEGSKLVIAAVGRPRRTLPTRVPHDVRLADSFKDPRVVLPGVLAVQGPPFDADDAGVDSAVRDFCAAQAKDSPICAFPCVVVVDNSEETARSQKNFLWVTFTRSNPAADIYGIDSFIQQKHWGCRGSLVIDARMKPHHAPPLVEDPAVTQRVDALAATGGPLHGLV